MGGGENGTSTESGFRRAARHGCGLAHGLRGHPPRGGSQRDDGVGGSRSPGERLASELPRGRAAVAPWPVAGHSPARPCVSYGGNVRSAVREHKQGLKPDQSTSRPAPPWLLNRSGSVKERSNPSPSRAGAVLLPRAGLAPAGHTLRQRQRQGHFGLWPPAAAAPGARGGRGAPRLPGRWGGGCRWHPEHQHSPSARTSSSPGPPPRGRVLPRDPPARADT